MLTLFFEKTETNISKAVKQLVRQSVSKAVGQSGSQAVSKAVSQAGRQAVSVRQLVPVFCVHTHDSQSVSQSATNDNLHRPADLNMSTSAVRYM